jgi:hypothetical protein
VGASALRNDSVQAINFSAGKPVAASARENAVLRGRFLIVAVAAARRIVRRLRVGLGRSGIKLSVNVCPFVAAFPPPVPTARLGIQSTVSVNAPLRRCA